VRTAANIASTACPDCRQSIARVCQEWADTKAAYRFLSVDRVSEANIVRGYCEATRERTAADRDAPVLMLHDTTEFSRKRDCVSATECLAKPTPAATQTGVCAATPCAAA